MEQPDPAAKPSSQGPIALLRHYLTARAPVALATDGLVLLISLLVAHLWQALYATLNPSMLNDPRESFLSAAKHPNLLFMTGHAVLERSAWIILGWAGVRAISDAVRSNAPGSKHT